MTLRDLGAPSENPSEAPSSVLSQIGVLSLGILCPLVLVYGFGASWYWIGLGGLAWVGALILKIPLAGIIYIFLPQNRMRLSAAASGMSSSITELGVAGFLFNISPPNSLIVMNILAFGAGAGCAEILFVLGAMYFEKTPAEKIAGWVKGANASFCVRYTLLIERFTALSGHVGARGLICLSLYSKSYELAVVALLSFALIDGLAAYGILKGWNWFEPITCRAFHGVCTGISIIEVTLFALFSMSVP